MAQTRIHDYQGEASSLLLNQRWYEAFGNIVLNGFEVEPGTSGLKVTIRKGAGLIGGLTFVENDDQIDALTLAAPPDAGARIDAVVAQYVYQQTTPPPTVSYTIVSGQPDPNGNPAKPSLGNHQLALGYITVSAGMAEITPDDIELPLRLRDRLQELVPHGVLTLRGQPFYVEVKTWVKDSDPTLTEDVEVGDRWVNIGEDPIGYYLWDGAQWLDLLDWETLRNKPDEYPPVVHELNGEYHTGDLPISRVSGHTAFGPPAHQEAFAASILRRPK